MKQYFIPVVMLVSLFIAPLASGHQDNAQQAFSLGLALGLLPGTYQEYARDQNRDQYQETVVAGIGFASISLPIACALQKALQGSEQREKSRDPQPDTTLEIATCGTWGVAGGYFSGFLMGSLARVCAGYDRLCNARAFSFLCALTSGMASRSGEIIAERALGAR